MTVTFDPSQTLEALLNGENITRADVPILLPADPYFDLAGEEFGQRLLLTIGADGVEYCLRPDFTLPIAQTYLSNGQAGSPAAWSYLGRIFRQRTSGPAEFAQAGLELIGQPDASAALDQVLRFAADAIAAYGIAPRTTFGSVELFESFLAQLDMPDVWRPRIRHRFGHPLALARLLERLQNQSDETSAVILAREELVTQAETALLDAGISIDASRSPAEIADRMLEKQALAAARVPIETLHTLARYLMISDDLEPAIAAVAKLAGEAGIEIAKPVAALRRHAETLENMTVRFEASFSPRLDYYTGIVFELSTSGGKILASGGQYDRLMQRLGATSKIAASGCAVWVDRLTQEAAQ